MLNPTAISDPTDPRLRDYANLTDAQLRDADWTGRRGVFIAEGELVVRRLLASRFPVRSLLLTDLGLERITDAIEALHSPPAIFIAPTQVLQAVVGFPFHRGILACGERTPDPPLQDLLNSSHTLLILEDLANADNVGAIFRNAGSLAGAARLSLPLSGASVLLSPGCCDPLYRKSLRVSMGQALNVPFARATPWPETVGQIAQAGFELIALTPHASAAPIAEFRPKARLALLLGAEGPGLTEPALAAAHSRLRIPMAPNADSLNVATAAAVALSHLLNPANL